MESLQEYFDLSISKDKMSASLDVKQEYQPDELTAEMLLNWLKENNVQFGFDHTVIDHVVSEYNLGIYPVEVAKGIEPVHGEDGQIEFLCERTDALDLDEKRSFRDIKKIPSLKENEKIARIIQPTKGKPGRNILDKDIPAKNGKPLLIRAGKNVRYDDNTNTFHATAVGQLSVGPKVINVFDTHEVSGDLSMKTGNVKFVGSVIIRGNVPDGYRVEAEGDVHIYGLVEAGHIEAGGNVIISEGIAGLKKGTIKSGGDITINYINQANVQAGKNIVVQNSIMHSTCVAKEHIYCKSGNIVGGSCSAGMTIEAKDIGNKMDTKTEIAIGINQEQFQLENQLNLAKKTLENDLEKLNKLGNGLEKKAQSSNGLSSKERILLLKQRNSVQLTEAKLEKVEQQIASLHVEIGEEDKARLMVKGTLYPNVDLCFGKYQKTTFNVQKFTQVYIEDGEITSQPL